MSSYKTTMLGKFDNIISSLEELVNEMPMQSSGRYNRGGNLEILSDDIINRFYTIRSTYLELLNSIPVKEERLQRAIDHLRDMEVINSNIRQLLAISRTLRSDYEAGLFIATKSSGNKLELAEQMLRENLYETEHFCPPYPESEIDRLEKEIKSSLLLGFGEESNQYQEIHSIFHPSVTSVIGGLSDKEKLKNHIEKWDKNRQKLLNSLNAMIKQINILAHQSEEQSNPMKAEISSTHSQNLWLTISILAGIILFIILRCCKIYTHSNKFPLDICISILFTCVILFFTCPQWRKEIVTSGFVSIGVLALSLLTGVQ